MLAFKQIFGAVLAISCCCFEGFAASEVFNSKIPLSESVALSNANKLEITVHTNLKENILNETEKLSNQIQQMKSNLNAKLHESMNDLLLNLKSELSEIKKSIEDSKSTKTHNMCKLWTPSKNEENSSNTVKFDMNLKCIKNCESNKAYKDCSEALTNAENKDGVYLLKEPGNNITGVYGAFCQRYNGVSWTIVQRRFDGSENFNRTWNDYKNGFGNPNGEYWLGLSRLYEILKNRDHELWIQVGSHDNEIRNIRYYRFAVRNEESRFSLDLSPGRGDALDSLKYNSNNDFITYDKGADECVKRYGGGWWFDNCGWSNLNGLYKSAENQSKQGVYWKEPESWLAKSLKYSHMAIRKSPIIF